MKTIILKTANQVRSFVKQCKSNNKIIAFIPTMGALHDGHLSLIAEAKKYSDIVIVSIFVNKAQFNDQSDFKKYPRNFDQDIDKLNNSGVDMVFYPDDHEIYPQNFCFKIVPILFNDCLCAKSRVGHFDGVALVVTKLFNIVQPDKVFFGEKDFQQLLIIKKLIDDLNFNIEIHPVKTLRESNGLAMSSRNQRLSSEGLKKASLIFESLKEVKSNINSIENQKQKLINNGFEIDYFEIRNELDLKLNNDTKSLNARRIFIAVYLEGIRLIDNLKL